MKRVVIGMGNPFRRDDGAGLEVARRLRLLSLRDVSVLEHGGEPAGLLDAWSGAGEVYVIDSVRGAEPGTVHHLRMSSQEPLAITHESGSTHTLGLGEAVELARALELLPPMLNVIGIEGSDFSTGEGVSPAVERAAIEVADELARRLAAEVGR